jgi:hypothetical protein
MQTYFNTRRPGAVHEHDRSRGSKSQVAEGSPEKT